MNKQHGLLFLFGSVLLLSLLLINPMLMSYRWFLLPIFFISYSILIYIAVTNQPSIDVNITTQNIHFTNIDILKWIAAIIIMILHLRPFLDINRILDLVFNNIISRICVPIFFVSAGYFTALKHQSEPEYIKRYIKQTIPLYLKFSIIYLPLGVLYLSPSLPYINSVITSFGFSQITNIFLWLLLIIAALLIALLYIGTYYHLWYFPALFISLFILDWFKKRNKIILLFFISTSLLIFGSFETYYGALPLFLKWLMDKYFMVFITTRNFLFFGLFYVTLGYLIYSTSKPFAKHCLAGLGISTIGLVFEVLLLQTIIRKDSNILLFSVPLVYFLFISALYTKPWSNIKFNFKGYSKYYYLWHPLIIFILVDVLHINAIFPSNPWIKVIILFSITHFISYACLNLENKKKHKI